MKIFVNPKNCKGCLRCVLACSFHHSQHKMFNPVLSSTRVWRDNDDKEIVMTVDDTCDLCGDEATLLCVQSCVFGAREVKK